MSRLLVNSVANFGKLMRNVGTKNYSKCPTNGLINYLENEISVLDSIHGFDVVSMNKETNVVKLVKDLPKMNFRMKVMFNLNMPYIMVDKNKSSSTFKFLDERIKQKSLGDVNFHSENDESLMKKMVKDDAIVVELDKGQSKNLVAVYKYDDSEKEFILNDFNMMSKYDKCLEPSSCDNTTKKHIKDVLEELGMEDFEDYFGMWKVYFKDTEFEKYSEIKNFFMP